MVEKRDLASKFMLIGGISWIAFGISHLFFPSVLKWKEVLSAVPSTNVFGIEISNVSFVYLFNADLFLYDVMLGILSVLYAFEIKKGKRMAAVYSISLGVYFLIRSPLQIYYFGTTLPDIFQAVAALIYSAMYLFPLTAIGEFAEE